jgi:hypothetical protein
MLGRRVIVLVAFAAACGGTSGGSGRGTSPSGGTVAEADLASALGHAICDNLASCCVATKHPFDANACLTAAAGIAQLLVNDAKGGDYDADAAGRCVVSLAERVRSTCSDNALDPSCDRIYRGSRAAGASCSHESDCIADGDAWATCDSGTCRVHRPPSGGEACGGPPDQKAVEIVDCESSHAPDWRCDLASRTCKRRAAAGAACVADDECADRNRCKSGTCLALGRPGAPCTTDEECTGHCDASICQGGLADRDLCGGGGP